MKNSSPYKGAEAVGITTTFYPDVDDVRFELSLANSEAWRDAGLPLVVVDGSPFDGRGKDRVGDAHRARGATVLRSERNGIASQRQQGAQTALGLGADKLLTHEPEKITMVNFTGEVASALENSAIVAVGRTEASEASLPPVQRRSERLAGWILEKTLILPHDALAGPRGYTRFGAEFLLGYPSSQEGMNNWIYMYQNMLEAMKAGKRVGGLDVDLMYPEAMVQQETGNAVFDRKRYDQFELQLKYLLKQYAAAPEAEHIAIMVRRGLDALPADRTNKDFEKMFTRLEEELAAYGYETAPAK